MTPANSAFTPSGSGGSVPISLSFNWSATVSADFSVPMFSIGAIPADGLYQFNAAITFRNGTADPPPATFVAEFQYVDGAGVTTGPATFLGITGGLDQTYLVQGITPAVFFSQAGSPFEISYGATGITGGSVEVTINISLIRLV